MTKIKIKNFGAIQEGYQEAGGYMDIKKVNVFIGDQGSGKSTIAKVFSSLSWLEKALNRGDVRWDKLSNHYFEELFEYQRINNYFKNDTYIEYVGDYMHFKYDDKTWEVPIQIINLDKKYLVPKIMFVPSERNFLSVIENANDITRLPGALLTFGEELKNAQKEFAGLEISLPISDQNIKYKYNPKEDASYIIVKGSPLNLLEAASGFQSLIPMFLVSKYLAYDLSKDVKDPREKLSVNQRFRLNEELARFNPNIIPGEEWIQRNEEIYSKYINTCFINIVEEPEQNLFPTSQRLMLQSLLEFTNEMLGNKLIITTHSPYLINYLTLAVEASKLKDKVTTDDLKFRLNHIVPLPSMINGEDLAIYQLDENNGSIEKLKTYKGLPSDENYLNGGLAESNELFSQLLEIEDLCQ